MSRRWLTAGLLVVVAGGLVWWTARAGGPVDPGCDGDPDGPSALVGFDPVTGSHRWETTVGTVLSAAWVDDIVITRAEAGVLRAHDIASGRLRWCVPFDEADPIAEVPAGMAGTGDGVAVPSGSDIVGYDAAGRERWRTPAPFHKVWLFGREVVWVFDGTGGRGQRGQRYVALDPTTGIQLSDAPSPPSSNPLMVYGFDSTPSSIGEYDLSSDADERTDPYDLDVAVSRSERELWRKHVPGELAAIGKSSVGPVVMVSDQTGGTFDRERFGEQVLTGYAAADGTELWSATLAGSPPLIAPLGASTVVVPIGSRLVAIDPATGTSKWDSDLGSPGQGGDYSLPGHYSLVTIGPSGTAVGLINAGQPYRD